MIDWEEAEGPKEAPPGLKDEVKAQTDTRPPSVMSTNAVAHWRRNLERFPKGHIGHQYALEALDHLTRFDKEEES